MAHRMTNEERKVIVGLACGDPRAFPIIHALCNVPYNRKGEVLRYMLAHGIVGNNLVEVYLKNKCSPFKMYKGILDKIDGHMARPLYVKDLV